MRKLRRELLCGSALAALMVVMALAPAASANVLVPGGSGLPDALTPTGPILADTGVVSFTTSPLLSGTVEEVVVADSGNTFCAGCLDFIFDISNSSTSKDTVVRSTSADFTGFSTDVGYNPSFSLLGGGSVIPVSVDRSLFGDTVGFSFAGFLPGTTSFDLVIETNATTFSRNGVVNLIDGGVSSIAGFAPLATPEPGSLLLLGSGLLSFGGLLRRRILGA